MKRLLILGLLPVFLLLSLAPFPAQVNVAFDCASVTQIPQLECEALVALYNSTNGPGWTDSTNWLVTNTPDDWVGVGVSSGHVSQLFLRYNNLSGDLPPEIGNLSGLRFLFLDRNQLSGPIPSEVGTLANLYQLDLSTNQLTGDIPESFVNLVNLYDAGTPFMGDGLDLDYNILIVPNGYPDPDIPLHVFLSQKDPDWQLSQYPSLTDCAEVSEIPEVECEALLAFFNSTNGIDWRYNTYWLVTRTPSNWYGVAVEAGHVTELRLANNQLTGSIPPQLGNLSQLNTLSLYANHLSGSIPVELGNLNNLKELTLTGNRLSGSIPVEISNLNLLWNLTLSGNQLSGSIPVELGNLSNLRFLSLSGNQLSGFIPVELGNLSSLSQLGLSGNQLSGSIPVELGNLPYLSYLSLSDNQLSGSIPVELGDLPYLSYLSLSGNQLSGSIPVELGNLIHLLYLYLAGNQLSGSIPPELGNLSLLHHLLLSDNQLSGSIPSELGNLSRLNVLHLNDNRLSGDVPDNFINLTSLDNPGTFWNGTDGLDLDYNELNVPTAYPDPSNPLHVFLNQKDPDWHYRQFPLHIFLPFILLDR